MAEHSTLEQHQSLLDAAERLRPLPGAVVELAMVICDMDADIDDIEAVVSRDPGLTAQALREANSVASAANSEIVHVEHAILRIGPARLLAMAMESALGDDLHAALPEYGYNVGELWAHLAVTSAITETVRELSTVRIGREVVAAALLHDVGKLVASSEPRDFRNLAAALADLRDRISAERAVWDIDHVELGAEVARVWKLPEPIVAAIAAHHDPGDLPEGHAIRIADEVAHLLAPTSAPSCANAEGLGASMQALGIERAELFERAVHRLERTGLLVPTAGARST